MTKQLVPLMASALTLRDAPRVRLAPLTPLSSLAGRRRCLIICMLTRTIAPLAALAALAAGGEAAPVTVRLVSRQA